MVFFNNEGCKIYREWQNIHSLELYIKCLQQGESLKHVLKFRRLPSKHMQHKHGHMYAGKCSINYIYVHTQKVSLQKNLFWFRESHNSFF